MTPTTLLSRRQGVARMRVCACMCAHTCCSPAFTSNSHGCGPFKYDGAYFWVGSAWLQMVCCRVYSSISFYCWFEDVSLSREIEKEATIFPNFQTCMTPGTCDPFTCINKYFQCREETSPQPTLHNCRVLYEGLQGACQSLFLNNLMIYLMPSDI